MLNCEEILQNIVSIFPIEAGLLSCSVPINVPGTPIVRLGEMTIAGQSYSSNTALVSHLKTRRCLLVEGAIEGGTHAHSVTIEDKPTVKATSKSTSSGRYFDTKVSCKSIEATDVVTDFFAWVSGWAWFDLFLLDSDDNLYLLRGQRSASNIELNQVLPQASGNEIELQIVSVNGIQKIE